jgi:hypothetical protein
VSSGLSAPTGSLSLTQNTADALVSKLRDGYVKAAGGYASMKAGSFIPNLDHGVAETFDCPEGGTAAFTPVGTNGGTYAYSACKIDGITYTGTSVATFTLEGDGIRTYALDLAGVVAVVEGTTVTLDEPVECSVADDGLGSTRESPQHAAGPITCVGRYSHNSYGADFHYSAGVADGSFQCECATNRWNMVVTGLTAAGGTAEAAAASGTALIRRLAANRFEVTITSNGQSSTFNVGS